MMLAQQNGGGKPMGPPPPKGDEMMHETGYFDMPFTLSLLFPLAPLAAICQPTFSMLSSPLLVTGFANDWVNFISGLPLLMWFVEPVRMWAPLVDFLATGTAGYFLYSEATSFSLIFSGYLWDFIFMASSLGLDLIAMVTVLMWSPEEKPEKPMHDKPDDMDGGKPNNNDPYGYYDYYGYYF